MLDRKKNREEIRENLFDSANEYFPLFYLSSTLFARVFLRFCSRSKDRGGALFVMCFEVKSGPSRKTEEPKNGRILKIRATGRKMGGEKNGCTVEPRTLE